MPVQCAKRTHYHFNESRLDETACQLVSSRSIAKACHLLVDTRRATAVGVDPGRFRRLKAGAEIYLFTSCIREFVTDYLPRLEEPFTLVTGGDDCAASRGLLGDAADVLLEHPLITRWYAQNAEIKNPKLTLIPIGIDYHTLAGNHSKPWRRFQSPRDQENQLLQVRQSSPDTADRSCTAYSNWHFAIDRGDRQECFDRIDHSCIFFEPRMVDRVRSWQNNARHLFTISPLGNGLDCHRTWEALALGTIPIVHTSPLDELYDGLPVCIINDWGEVDEQFLLRQKENMLTGKFDYSRLLSGYWRCLIQGNAPQNEIPSETISSFARRLF